jgi:hypothetical protein
MTAVWWWMRQVGLTVLGLFFLLFGIQLLVSAYSLKNPSYFILTFFASNLIILISGVLLLGFILRMISRFRTGKEGEAKKENKII